MKEITVLQLTQLVGVLSSTIQAVLPAQIHFRYLQCQQMSALKGGMTYKEKIILNDQALGKLQCWIKNLTYFNGRFLIKAKPQIVIQADAYIKADPNYCRISPGYSEHKNRLPVSSQQRLVAIEVVSNSIPTYFPENGDVSDRSVCFQVIQSNSKIFCLETRPTQFICRCNATRMEPGNFICISPLFVNSESTLENSKGESQYSNTKWQTQLWHPNLLVMSFSQLFLLQRVLKNPNGEDHPLVINKSLALVAWKVTGKP